MVDATRTDIRDARNGNIRETRVIERRHGSGWGALIAFLIGGILIGAAAVLLMNVHGTLSWPAGRLDFNLRPVSSSFTQPPNAAAANTLATNATTANASAAPAATAVTVQAANTPSIAPPATAPAGTNAAPQAAPTPDAQTPNAATP